MKGDMIVKLYNLEDSYDFPKLKENNINIIRPLSPDNEAVLNFIKTNFSASWASETAVALNQPFATCFIAVKDKKIIGFAAFEATGKAFFGPTGVDPTYRGLGVGTALLLKSLLGLRDLGYTYAIIGGVDSAREFYKKTVGAEDIPDSFPAIYQRVISRN